MTSIAHVTVSYTSQYPDPIAFEKGDLVTLTGRTDNWNGHTWLWAVASKDGREGWVPDCIIDAKKGTKQHAILDYDAQELSCQEGECLTVLEATHGWCWCENQDGQKGWVPEENLNIKSQG